MTATPTTTEELLDYWPGNIPFKGSLVNEDGSCMCAQGQALHFLDGLTVDQLRDIKQQEADKRVSELFGISRAHSILLRIVNDGRPGAPTCVIRNPEQVLGDQSQVVLAFWRHLDCMTPAAWEAAREAATEAATEAAGEAAWAWAAAWAEAWEAAVAAAASQAGEAATEASWAAAWAAAGALAGAAAKASNEIQGAAVMRAKNQPFFFLPLFGFADPESVISTST